MKKLRYVVSILKEMHKLPPLTLTICNEYKSIYNYFTKPHPRYKIIQNKKWGVAIQQIPNSFVEYLGGRQKQALRTNRNRCLRKGYYFDSFPAGNLLSEIMQINTSLPLRQGRQMNPAYIDKSVVEKWISSKTNLYGVFNENNKLVAYAYVPVIGDVCMISRILGHADSLDDGIMYLLVSELMYSFIKIKAKRGQPKYMMYDTFFGAASGLKYFKERIGFRPYKIEWRLE